MGQPKTRWNDGAADGTAITNWVRQLTEPPFSVWPHLFCGAGHKKKRGEQLKWLLTFRLYIWKFSMCTATRTSSYSPVGPNVFLGRLPQVDLIILERWKNVRPYVRPSVCPQKVYSI